MLKRTIKYKNFDDEDVEEIFYFNISKPELVGMELGKDGGFSAWIQRVVKAENHKVLMEEFEKLIMLAYGEKSEDGKHFMKSEELSQKFKSSAAYIALFNEMITDDKAASDFFIGVLPKEIIEANKEALTPAPPSA